MRKILFIFIPIISLLVLFTYIFYHLGGILPSVLPPSGLIKEEQTTSTNLGFNITEGFSIDIFAQNLGKVRVIKFDEKGNLLASITSEGKIIAIPDKNRDGKADNIIVLAQNLNKPHGLEIRGDKIYIAQEENILVFDYDSENLKLENRKKVIDLPSGGRHFTRTIEFENDSKLYVSIGSTCDTCFENDERLASIITVDVETQESKVFAQGLRNSVFFTFHPETHQIWATEMGRDFLGDDIPPDEINIIKENKNYGWPICWGNRIYDEVFDAARSQKTCQATEAPIFEICAHCAPLGITFIDSEQFPQSWQGDLLVAYHGSWNRSTPVGYKVVRLKILENEIINESDFISGFLGGVQARGRPVDFAFDKHGTLYVSDDKAEVIYRVGKIN